MVIWMIYTWTCTLSQEGDIQKTVWVLRYLSLVHFFSFKRLCQSCLKGKGRNHWKNSFLTTEIPTPHGLDAVWTQTLPYSIYARESNHYYNKFQFPKNGQFAFLLVLAGPWSARIGWLAKKSSSSLSFITIPSSGIASKYHYSLFIP